MEETRYTTAGRARAFMARPANTTSRRVFPGPVFGGGVTMTATESFEFNALPDTILLGWLTTTGHRPNVLIQCTPGSVDAAMRHLMTWCALPFRYCSLPGPLELPNARRGSLLLRDIAALSLSQQVSLYDWLSGVSGDTQVISLTTAPLRTLVEDGEFLEGLYYRLNVIRLAAHQGTRPAPLDTWQTTHDRTV
jgi:hypothetical protein